MYHKIHFLNFMETAFSSRQEILNLWDQSSTPFKNSLIFFLPDPSRWQTGWDGTTTVASVLKTDLSNIRPYENMNQETPC